MTQPPKRNWQDARDAGVTFYEMPDALSYATLDPLIGPLCSQINHSGWVATGESCQGHVDDLTGNVWAGNLGPFLRLICYRLDYGLMLALLSDACGPDLTEGNGAQRYHSLRLRIHRNAPKGEWESANVYIDASTTFERDEAIGALMAFALWLNTPSVLARYSEEKSDAL